MAENVVVWRFLFEDEEEDEEESKTTRACKAGACAASPRVRGRYNLMVGSLQALISPGRSCPRHSAQARVAAGRPGPYTSLPFSSSHKVRHEIEAGRAIARHRVRGPGPRVT